MPPIFHFQNFDHKLLGIFISLRLHSTFFVLGINLLSSVQSGENLDPIPPINGSVHILCTIITNFIASATEAEIEAVFRNA